MVKILLSGATIIGIAILILLKIKDIATNTSERIKENTEIGKKEER